MNVEVIVRIDGQEMAAIEQRIETAEAAELEEQVGRLKDRLGRVVLEVGLSGLARALRRPCCCGRSMENRGRRTVTITSLSGPVVLERTRYRCRVCGASQTPADRVICCGRHRMTRPLAKRVCQLATLDHFSHLERLMADQHGVCLGHDPMMKLVHDVGGRAESERLAEARFWQNTPASRRRWPEPEVTPRCVYVSCDGVMYCTNQSEPDPQHAGCNRLIWKQMRVGCVSWQDEHERWHKRIIWGQEEDYQSFGASLYRLACRCGYRQADPKIFAADGGEWCWGIHQQYFADATGILDWYHTSEHVWACGHALQGEEESARLWVHEALETLRHAGGEGLLHWLLQQRPASRGRRRDALDALIHYVQPRLDRMDYPAYRSQKWAIGTGMIESTGKQLVGIRLKGPGMHWCPHGATAVTALRATDLNQNWHHFWKALTL
jgi:hypothetical protein